MKQADPAKPILKKLAPAGPLKHRVLPPVDPVSDETVPSVDPVSDETVPATRALVKAAKAAPIQPAAASREQEALVITREILDTIAHMKRDFVRVAILLARVRDEKLYAFLGHDSLEQYAQARLGLGRDSLDRYLKIFQWLRDTHPECLEPGANCPIADLSDAEGLIWIEEQLARQDLTPTGKSTLQNLKKKALSGNLRRTELRAYQRKQDQGRDSLKSFLASLRKLRKSGAKLSDMPTDIIPLLDTAIERLKNNLAKAKG